MTPEGASVVFAIAVIVVVIPTYLGAAWLLNWQNARSLSRPEPVVEPVVNTPPRPLSDHERAESTRLLVDAFEPSTNHEET